MRKYYISVEKSCILETEKAIGLHLATGYTGKECGIKWLPKSQIDIHHPEEYASETRVKINVPAWLIKDILYNKYVYFADAYLQEE